MLLDELHQRAQQQLREATGNAVAGVVNSITLEDRSPQVIAGYRTATSRLTAGGQRAAAQLALAYLAAYAPPVEEADVGEALDGVGVSASSASSVAGLLRLWRMVDDGDDEADAREAAGNYAAGVAADELHAAERAGLDEGARAGDMEGLRWRLEPNAGACEWCLFIASTGARYLEAESVPVPHSPDNASHPGGICQCSVAPESMSDYIDRTWPDGEPDELEFDENADWEHNREAIKQLDTSEWFKTATGPEAEKQLSQMKSIGKAVDDEAKRRYIALQLPGHPSPLAADLRLQVLSELRPMGGELEMTIARNKGLLTEAMDAGRRVYPTDWMDALNARGPWTVSKVSRGYYSDWERKIALSTYGAGGAKATAIHEIGHGVQYTNARVSNAEHLFHRQRTTVNGVREPNRALYNRSRPKERGRPDKYPDVYSGREYPGRAREVLTTTAESIFSPVASARPGGYRGYADQEMTNWLLGAMATL